MSGDPLPSSSFTARALESSIRLDTTQRGTAGPVGYSVAGLGAALAVFRTDILMVSIIFISIA